MYVTEMRRRQKEKIWSKKKGGYHVMGEGKRERNSQTGMAAQRGRIRGEEQARWDGNE
jgi:hypothetical protein